MSVYGNDLILQDGDILSTAKGTLYSSDDYETFRGSSTLFPGYYAMIFAIADAIFTVKGDIAFHPEYGSDMPYIVGQNASPAIKELITKAITDAALADLRVKSVQSVVVDIDGSTAYTKANLILSGRTEAATFVFPNFLIGQ